MEGLFLLVIYGLVLLLQIVALIRAAKGKTGWDKPLRLEVFSLLAALALGFVFDHLPGRGFMPGLTYMGETLFSFGAAAVYLIMLLVTFLFMGFQK